MTKYTKAVSITPNDSGTIDPIPNAIYIGDGNQADYTTAAEIEDPTIWLNPSEMDGTRNGWADSSGNDFDFACAGAETVAQNNDGTALGHDYMTFSGHGLEQDGNDSDFDLSGEFEMIVVFRPNTSGYGTIIAKDRASSEFQWHIRTDDKMQTSMSGSDPIGATALTTDGTVWYFIGFSRDSSDNLQLWLNGATDGSSASNDVDLTSTDDWHIGSRDNSTNDFIGDIAEVIIYCGKTLGANRSAVYDYLTQKYITTPKKAQIQMMEDTGDVSTLKKWKNFPVGEIVEASPQRIYATNTNATGIICLYEK